MAELYTRTGHFTVEAKVNGRTTVIPAYPSHPIPDLSGVPPGATLHDHHAGYIAARGVADEARDARGYWTARTGTEIPPEFSRGLRYGKLGGETLVIPMRSPDGKTTSHLIRHDRPKPDRSKPGSKPGKTRKFLNPGRHPDRPTNILDVHPWMLGAVRHGDGPLWITEGPLKGDALASWGRPAVVIAGVNNWHLKGGDPLRCWQHVALSGRRVYVAFDADYRTNATVQTALNKLVAFLEGRGARVLVVSVPEVDADPKTGVDDWIARHGDPAPLERDASPFAPADVGHERLSRDERLRRSVAYLRLEVDGLEARKSGQCSAVAVARYLVEVAAPDHGKPQNRGIKVRPSGRQIAAGVRVALGTVFSALDRLEAVGFLERIQGTRGTNDAASYLLICPPEGGRALLEHIEGGRPGRTDSQEQGEREFSLSKRGLHPRVQVTRRGADRSESMPVLRNPKLVHTWARKDGRRVVVDSVYVARYGKRREAIMRYVLDRGDPDEAEVHGKFGSKTSRLRDFRRRVLGPMLEDGVLVSDGRSLQMAPEWPATLERVRQRTDEDLDNRLQDQKYTRQRTAYRQARDNPTDPTPKLAGPERVADIVAAREHDAQAARVEEQRRKVGMTPEVFLDDALRDASGFGWRELRALWIAKDGKPDDLRRAVRAPYRFRREYAGGPLYVERRDTPAPDRDPAPVANLYTTRPKVDSSETLANPRRLTCDEAETVKRMMAEGMPAGQARELILSKRGAGA